MTIYSSFHDKLQRSKESSASEHYRSFLLRSIDGATKVESASERTDRDGADFWVHVARGSRLLAVDLKAREQGCSRYWRNGPELYLETWSVVPGTKTSSGVGVGDTAGVVGWTLDDGKNTDYVLFVFDPFDTEEVYLLPFSLLRCAFRRNLALWRKRYGRNGSDFQQGTKRASYSYRSAGIPVPASVVLRAVASEMQPSLFGFDIGRDQA